MSRSPRSNPGGTASTSAPPWNRKLAAARVSSLLRAAARITPVELRVSLNLDCNDAPFELPCFGRATSIRLRIFALNVTLPPAGEFALLERLVLRFCVVDLEVLLPRGPRLRELVVLGNWRINTLAILSTSLEELVLGIVPVAAHGMTPHVDIVAPVLKFFRWQPYGAAETTVSFSAPPMVVEFSFLHLLSDSISVGFGDKWRLRCLRMDTAWRQGPALFLSIDANGYSPAKRTITQETARLSVIDFSVLVLDLYTKGHVFGATVLHLLKIQTAIQRLTVTLCPDASMVEDVCSQNCPCDQPNSWRNERISLPDLEVVQIDRFSVADHEVDFLILLFGSAPSLKRMTISLSAEASPSNGGREKLRGIFEANPSVECFVS